MRLERDPAHFMDLYVMDADGTDIRRLTDAPGYDGGPFWSADGEKITWRRFSEDGARAEVYTMNADGTGERRITDLEAHVAALTDPALEGRLTGTAGGRAATGYVAAAFEALGLDPAGTGGSYFQPFRFTPAVALAQGNRLGVSVDGEMRGLALDEDWRPLAFSRTGSVEEAGVVFAGYGIVAPEQDGTPGLNSYDGLDVEGNWVLVWRGMPGALPTERRRVLSRVADRRCKASVAKTRGAAGVILAPPPRGMSSLPRGRARNSACSAPRILSTPWPRPRAPTA